MMLIATTVAVALLASTAIAAGAPALSASTIPETSVNVTASADVSPALVARVLAEAAAIWRPSGVTFVWRRAAPRVVPCAEVSDTGPYVPNALRLTIGGNRGSGRPGGMPLGWIVFDDLGRPEQEIYLSHANARAMLEDAPGVVGMTSQMPIAQQHTMLGRAMGRALAHELGHYLLASKVHTRQGLMKAVLTAVELFMPDVSGLRVEPAQRVAIAARLRGEPLVASR